MSSIKIFLVEDDSWMGELLKHHLSLNPDYEVLLFKTASDALRSMHLKPNIIGIDFGLPDMSGDVLLEKIQAIDKSIPVIVISGQEDIGVAVNFLKKGVKDYIVKDEHTKEMLWNAILRIKEKIDLQEKVEVLKEQLEVKHNFEKTIIGKSETLKKIFHLVDKAIHSNINVSITGETGTGKEVIAKAIHFNGERKRKNFVAVNMAAIPSELIESELFGHEKGSFTGANGRRIGKFEEASGGTIFLDEIAELDLSLQSKILRVLQERELLRVGGNEIVKLNLRVISATHKNLSEQVKKGKFREDLFYRIIGLPIELPPLRERGDDVLILAKHFVEEYVKENKVGKINFSTKAMNKLLKYDFPGNVRELKSVIELACVMCNGKEINYEDIRFSQLHRDKIYSVEEKTLKDYNNDIIHLYLKKYNNDVLEVAKRLDIGKSTIYNLINKGEIKK
jgi:DNA-binding NtrC family response regulator